MKNIKLRIVYLILGAALLLFALFMLAVNVVIPAHFVSEAEKALRNEAQYENRTIPYTYEGEVYDDDWDDGAEEHFFTPSIVFLELENGYQPNTWSQDTYRLEKKLLAYCSERSVAPNRCHDFKADKHHLIFMPVQEDYGNSEEPYSYIMYIDIGPITRYIVTLNWAFFGVLLAISSVMCLLGFRFGRDIEKETERQQTFFQNASHELKTPLASIKLLTDSILQNNMDMDTVKEFVEDIGNEADRLNRMTAKLLSLTRAENPQPQESEIIYMAPTVQRVAKMLRTNASWSGVTFCLELDEDTPVLILEDDLYQIVFNLMENGIKYNHAGGYVWARAEMADGRAVVTVADNGVGIAPEDQQRVFERFYRVDKSRSKQTGGTGLGLSIVKHGAQVHHAQIAMQSALGEGTTITLTFPAQSSGKK